MNIPEHLWRFDTREVIDSLARRFNLPNDPSMQDWPYEVADPERIDEFLVAYHSDALSEDERFTLMEMIIQSFEDLGDSLQTDHRWPEVLKAIEEDLDIHIYSVWYWSDPENSDAENIWRVAPFLRRILLRNQSRYEKSSLPRAEDDADQLS